MIDRAKARLVAKGYGHVEVVDYSILLSQQHRPLLTHLQQQWHVNLTGI